jgi:hypothetical protein
MTNPLFQGSRFAIHACALLSLMLLAGCIDSERPLLTDAQPLLGERLHLQFYSVRDGAAHEPVEETFVWRGGRYAPIAGTGHDIGDFTLHAFTGADLIVQSLRPGKPAEYAIARKIAEAAYLVVAIDESDADDATRGKFCSTAAGTACRVRHRRPAARNRRPRHCSGRRLA